MKLCRFSCGHGDRVVSEAGDQVEPTAERLNVAGDGVDCGDLASLDLGYCPGVTPRSSASCA
jgi:hypothetical protein